MYVLATKLLPLFTTFFQGRRRKIKKPKLLLYFFLEVCKATLLCEQTAGDATNDDHDDHNLNVEIAKV